MAFTKADKQFLKDNFATKDDLKDMRSQITDQIDGKLAAQSRNFLEEIDKKLDDKLSKQKEGIVKDVADYIADTIVPMFEKKDEQVVRIEKKLGLPPLAD